MVLQKEPGIDPYPAAHSTGKPVIGLAGGIASGKSTVAGILASLGAVVISSDAISQQELDSPQVHELVRQWWGSQVFGSDGKIDRQKVADIVFADPPQKRRLEALLHPRVAARREQRIAELQRREDVPAIVIDSPLLFETGLDALCDAVIFIDASPDARLARATATRGWDAQELARREALQQSLDAKRARADYVCGNFSGTKDLRRQVEDIYSEIVSSRHAD